MKRSKVDEDNRSARLLEKNSPRYGIKGSRNIDFRFYFTTDLIGM